MTLSISIKILNSHIPQKTHYAPLCLKIKEWGWRGLPHVFKAACNMKISL